MDDDLEPTELEYSAPHLILQYLHEKGFQKALEAFEGDR